MNNQLDIGIFRKIALYLVYYIVTVENGNARVLFYVNVGVLAVETVIVYV